jgi:hypothetical protein
MTKQRMDKLFYRNHIGSSNEISQEQFTYPSNLLFSNSNKAIRITSDVNNMKKNIFKEIL